MTHYALSSPPLPPPSRSACANVALSFNPINDTLSPVVSFRREGRLNSTSCTARHSCCCWSWAIIRNTAQLAVFVSKYCLDSMCLLMCPISSQLKHFRFSDVPTGGRVPPDYVVVDLHGLAGVTAAPPVEASAAPPPDCAAASRSKQCTTTTLLAELSPGHIYFPERQLSFTRAKYHSQQSSA